MIQSLTASTSFSSEEYQDSSTFLGRSEVWYIQLRSLNQRFFELNCQIPNFVAELEVPLKKLLQRKLVRGRIEFRLNYANKEELLGQLKIDHRLLKQELRQLHDLERITKNLGFDLLRPNSLDILQHCRKLQRELCENMGNDLLYKETLQRESGCGGQGELQGQEKGSKQEHLLDWQQSLLNFCADACAQLVLARQREGQELHHELLQLHQDFVIQCEQANQLETEISSYYSSRLQENFQKWEEFQQAQITPKKDDRPVLSEERLLSELSLFLAKGDVREELSRLDIHAKGFFEILQRAAQASTSKASACAKELDFLLQEMNREVNTLGSKSPLVQLQQIAIRMKMIIEQMREQTKNVL